MSIFGLDPVDKPFSSNPPPQNLCQIIKINADFIHFVSMDKNKNYVQAARSGSTFPRVAGLWEIKVAFL